MNKNEYSENFCTSPCTTKPFRSNCIMLFFALLATISFGVLAFVELYSTQWDAINITSTTTTVSITPNPTIISTPPTRSYGNYSEHYSFLYPQDWTVKENGNDHIITLPRSEEKTVEENFRNEELLRNITTGCIISSEEGEEEEFLVNYLKKKLDYEQMNDLISTKVGRGLKGFLLREGSIDTRWVLVQSKIYQIACKTTTKDKEDTTSPPYEIIVDSFSPVVLRTLTPEITTTSEKKR